MNVFKLKAESNQLIAKLNNIHDDKGNCLIAVCASSDIDEVRKSLEYFEDEFNGLTSFNITERDDNNFYTVTCEFSRTWPASYELYFTAISNDWYKKKLKIIPLYNLFNLEGKISLRNIRLVEKLARCLYSN
ncbi:MAG TPA: hypothetical protein VIG40_02310, partial [Tissierellaceae bacterium]